jgi:hypothetical protein
MPPFVHSTAAFADFGQSNSFESFEGMPGDRDDNSGGILDETETIPTRTQFLKVHAPVPIFLMFWYGASSFVLSLIGTARRIRGNHVSTWPIRKSKSKALFSEG